jgi:hypothetical protein
VTVSERSLKNGGFEFKRRDQQERWIVAVEDAIREIRHALMKMEGEVQDRFA